MNITAHRILVSAAGLATAVALLATGSAEAQAPTTKLTIRVVGCETCEVGLTSALDDAGGDIDVWSAKPKRVRDGRVTFVVPTDRTVGLSIPISAPWEGHTGYVALASLRYAGTDVGDRVSFREARDQRRASGCWAGTGERSASLRVKVRRVTVPGNTGPAAGVMAWTPRTQPYLEPMERVYDGVKGTQDVTFCNPVS